MTTTTWKKRLTSFWALTLLCSGLATTTVAARRWRTSGRARRRSAQPVTRTRSPASRATCPAVPSRSGTAASARSGSWPDANGAMAVAGTCAYTGGGLEDGTGVRVIDVSDPTAPALVRVLETSSRELLAAEVTEESGPARHSPP